MTPVVMTDAPAVDGPPQGRWTVADWETLPKDGNRYEVIDGVLYMTTAPSYFHQWIVAQLMYHIGWPAQQRGLGYAVPAPVGVIMPGSDPVQPDFVFVRASRASIIRNKRIMGAPDVIAEIMSPGSAAYDQDTKVVAYARADVPEYAIVNPGARSVTYYRLEAPGRYAPAHVLSEAETLSFECLPAISVPVGHLFAGSPDTTL